MELFPPLTRFYNSVAEDPRISATHISLYMALLQQWNLNGGKNPIAIKRTFIMKSAKISARRTYNKHINELQQYGYIFYKPSVNLHSVSVVCLMGM